MGQSSFPLTRFVAICVALAFASAGAWAQDQASAEPLETVQVKQLRDPLAVPYRSGYEWTEKMLRTGGDHVQLAFRVVSSSTKLPVPELDISIEGSRSFGKLEISPEGFFTVPLDKDAYDDNAEFITNQKKG